MASSSADLNLFISEDEAAEFEFDRPAAGPVPSEKAPMGISSAGNHRSTVLEAVNLVDDVLMAEENLNNVPRSPSVPISNDSTVAPAQVKTVSEQYSITADDLYCSLGMDLDTSPLFVAKYRLDTLHIRGVEEMSTAEVLAFFHEHVPQKVEWVNDTCCNVVFESNLLALKAMISQSKPLKIFKKPPQDAESNSRQQQSKPEVDLDTGEDVVVSDVASFPIPVPQGKWRVANNPPSKSKTLIFRFARTNDKKPSNAQKFSQYYVKHGHPRESEPVTRSAGLQKSAVSRWSQHATESSQSPGLRFVYSEPRQSSAGPIFSRLSPRHHDLPYDRSPRDHQIAHKNNLPQNDLRDLLHKRSDISNNDLRHRLSLPALQPVLSRNNSDLRNRLNNLRRNS